MIASHSFRVPFYDSILHAESSYGDNGHILMLHGGGKDRTIFYKYREILAGLGFGTTIFDFLGHGETGGDIYRSSLYCRTRQAQAIIAAEGVAFTGCIGVSMGAYTALQLSKTIRFRSLILMVPGVYSSAAYQVNFGDDFSAIIRKHRSWEHTDAWDIAAQFDGHLLVIAAENDAIIPAEIPNRLISSATACRQKQLLIVADAGHNSIWDSLQRSPACYQKVCLAFNQCLSY